MAPKHKTRKSNSSSCQNVARDNFNQRNSSPGSLPQLSSTSKAVCYTPRRRYSSGSTASRQETKDAETPLLITSNQVHDLQGIGAQFSSLSYAPVLPSQLAGLSHTLPSKCSYHHQILDPKHPPARPSTPLESYLNTQPSEQYALYYQPEANTISTMRNCTCLCSRGNARS
ncbi:hypothetical protein NA56DRAFT_702017 [Hyaloscypha hepaticicola]|uniref:Uncharacterized protein n=1 Tax=Hyaloscypha hepaticicola TaxID=2082293 RepID=A0A2J6Q9J9_9HELO|nr:hypothetical protein NA56DRAFT_702017 [Hyaloscypha hepaticicola]